MYSVFSSQTNSQTWVLVGPIRLLLFAFYWWKKHFLIKSLGSWNNDERQSNEKDITKSLFERHDFVPSTILGGTWNRKTPGGLKFCVILRYDKISMVIRFNFEAFLSMRNFSQVLWCLRLLRWTSLSSFNKLGVHTILLLVSLLDWPFF